MDELEQRIAEIEARAIESAQIAEAATDCETRTYNARLAEELWQYASLLRKKAGTMRVH